MHNNASLLKRAAAMAEAAASKSRWLLDTSDPDHAVHAIRDVLMDHPRLFVHGVPVLLQRDETTGHPLIHRLSPDHVIRLVHSVSRPYAIRGGNEREVDVALSKGLAGMYLTLNGEWQLRVLRGIAPAPLLSEDGTIYCRDGYDIATGMWCDGVPDISDLVPSRPTKAEAEAALRQLRTVFRTFCYADATTISDRDLGVDVTNVDTAPGEDESALLVGLLTAVCRPSLRLAPAIIIRAPKITGAGAGKGLLARCMCEIAFGQAPHAITGGGKIEELEKRVTAELMAGYPTLFLDNLNDLTLQSDLLASAISESPARVRILGKSETVLLAASVFMVFTGNSLAVSEDLIRRCVTVELDPRVENPESRPFNGNILASIRDNRITLLTHCLTIWRWGRQSDLPAGRPVGSFEQWSRWTRDPLVALGCKDPVEQMSRAKQSDVHRQNIKQILEAWHRYHGSTLVSAAKLDHRVGKLLAGNGASRQAVAAAIPRLVGTRLAGFCLNRQPGKTNWAPDLYWLASSGNEAPGDPEQPDAGTPG